MDGRGVTVPVWVEARISTSQHRPERLWGPPSLLSKWITGALYLRVKRPGREDDSLPTSAKVKKKVDLHIHSPIRLHCVVLN
jgi:hypothetical protein